jgi:hypothetical protein
MRLRSFCTSMESAFASETKHAGQGRLKGRAQRKATATMIEYYSLNVSEVVHARDYRMKCLEVLFYDCSAKGKNQ